MVKFFFLPLAGVILVFGLGFGVFYVALPTVHKSRPQVEAFAVFTGGTGRVAAGLNVLQQAAKPTLITGIHPQVSLSDLLQGKQISADKLALLTLDHTAETTRQNMAVLAAWAKRNGYSKIGVISSHYHYPRIFVLAALYAPQVEVFALPVRVPTSFMFYAREYAKLWVSPFLK